MSDSGVRPPSRGWYAIGGNPNDLAYFDGELWTWRGRRGPNGEWHQEPILPPAATAPPPESGGPQAGPQGPQGPRAGAPTTARGAYPGLPGYPGGPPYGPSGPYPGQFSASRPPFRPPGRLDLRLTEPDRQARWVTLLRGLLVIPSWIALGLLGIAVFFVTIAMWFVALITARVPESLWRFSVDVLKWQARTYAYTFFLTDRYPPFTLGDAPYPVSIAFDGPPDRFNRLAVLVRLFLMIPAAIVVGAFTYGVELFSIAAWLLTLVRGKCPRPLHLVVASWLRYSLRFSAYQLLLTTEYPRRPLGDPPSDYGAATLQNGDIVLSGSARGLAIAAIVVGAMAYLGSSAAQAALSGTSLRARNAIVQLNALESRAVTAATTYRNEVTACQSSTWRCERAAMPVLLDSLGTQISSLEIVTFPSAKTQHDADVLVAALRRERTVVAHMDHAVSSMDLGRYARRLTAVTRHLQPLARKLAADLDAIG